MRSAATGGLLPSVGTCQYVDHIGRSRHLLKSGVRAAVPSTLKRVVRRVVVELNKREEGSASRALN